MHLVRCSYCGTAHDIEALEPSFRRPDAFLQLAGDQAVQTRESKDACALRAADDSWRRFFLRVLVPFTVAGLDTPISWGAWVEVSEAQFERVSELWDHPSQGDEPPFMARFANATPLYSDTLTITGLVSLSDPSNVPTFHMLAPPDHIFVSEQRTGVSPSRAAEWLIPVYHPEWIVQQRINQLVSQNAEKPQTTEEGRVSRTKRWWQWWRSDA